MIKNDIWIIDMAQKGLIKPFESKLVRRLESPTNGTFLGVISYGVSSYGYDIRLSGAEFKIFRHIPGTVLDPKKFNPGNLETAELQTDESGSYFIIPAHSYALGVAVEELKIPNDVTVIAVGKSTYARCGIIANLTPAEAGWRGHLTLEFSNSSHTDCRMYANEGVVQLIFMGGDPCAVSYETRQGKYQGQQEVITLAKV
jgi:dCTP deaminase